MTCMPCLPQMAMHGHIGNSFHTPPSIHLPFSPTECSAEQCIELGAIEVLQSLLHSDMFEAILCVGKILCNLSSSNGVLVVYGRLGTVKECGKLGCEGVVEKTGQGPQTLLSFHYYCIRFGSPSW